MGVIKTVRGLFVHNTSSLAPATRLAFTAKAYFPYSEMITMYETILNYGGQTPLMVISMFGFQDSFGSKFYHLRC